MSPTDQQSAADATAPADADVPAEHEVPEALVLAAEFDAATREQWRELVAGVLRKAGRDDLPDPVEDALAVTVATGVTVEPLYTAEDAGDLATTVGVPGLAPFVRGARAGGASDGGVPAGWDVRQRHAHPDPAVTKEAIAADLENGVTSLWLVLGEGAIPVDALGDVLSDVLLDLAPVTVQGGLRGRRGVPVPRRGAHRPRARQLPGPRPARSAGRVGRGAGPVRAGRRRPPGRRPRGSADGRRRRHRVRRRRRLRGGGAGLLDRRRHRLPAGAHRGRPAAPTRRSAQLEFRYSATADQFTTIAALRAARRLWDRVGEASGVAPERRAQRQHAVTSSVMTTKHDPWVNMLRTTVACFAAGVGGADVVTVQPFDAALGLPDAFARRIARNTQSLLVEEGHLARVLDPAGGSWYVESLTDQLAQAAWDWFTEIERAGGLAAALDSGLVRDRLAAAWDARAARIATRKDPITGVSEFPNLAEKLPDREPAAAVLPSGGLPRVRAAQGFEELRDRAASADRPPRVYLATIGPIARHTARAGFAGNLFQAGGLETPSGDGVDGFRRGRDDGRLHLRHRQGLRGVGRRAGRRAEGGRRDAGVAGRQAGARSGRRRRLRVRRLRRARRRCAPCTSELGAQA